MKKYKVILLYLAIALAIFIVLESIDGFANFGGEKKEKEYQEFIQEVKEDKVGRVVFHDGKNLINYWYKDSVDEEGKYNEKKPDHYTIVPSLQTFTDDMNAIFGDGTAHIPSDRYSFTYVYVPKEPESIFILMLPYILIIGIALIFMFIFMRAQTGGSGNIINFSRSRAKIQSGNKTKFADVAGADEEKDELKEIVDFMKRPERFTSMGARIPKGVLLVGPPGTGKTLLARAVAGEADVPFYSISGSDFVEMFVGVGASRVRDLFNTAKKTAPALIFIDEIDAVGRQRGAGLGGGHDEREQTLNQLLVEMDGFEANEGIIVIAATNRPDILDPALLRPGRFDRRITVHIPDIRGREEILKVHAKNKRFASDVSFSSLAAATPGFTGADLENMLNEAAILATRRGLNEITMAELNEAATRVMMGPEKRSRLITARDKEITAYHEAGHAVASLKLENCDPVREISIIPRGQAAGYTMTSPGNEYSHISKSKLYDEIAMLLGGRATEEIILGEVCTGAHSDLKRATEIARKMVTEYGMSDNLGPLFLGGDTEVFVGRDFAQHSNLSDAFAARIDDEVKAIIETQYERIKKIISENIDGIKRACSVLIKREYLTGEQFERIFNGEDEEAVFAEPVMA